MQCYIIENARDIKKRLRWGPV